MQESGHAVLREDYSHYFKTDSVDGLAKTHVWLMLFWPEKDMREGEVAQIGALFAPSVGEMTHLASL